MIKLNDDFGLSPELDLTHIRCPKDGNGLGHVYAFKAVYPSYTIKLSKFVRKCMSCYILVDIDTFKKAMFVAGIKNNVENE